MKPSTIIKPISTLKLDSFRALSDHRFGALGETNANWDHYQTIVATFFDGLYHALDYPDQNELAANLDLVCDARRGFAYEGAAMGLVFLDFFLPYKKRFQSFLEGTGAKYELLLYIGAGMALGYLGKSKPFSFFNRSPQGFVDRYPPLYRWLVMDGYGFFDGMVNWQRVISRTERPSNLRGYALRAYDQGVGRSLWICTGGDAERFTSIIRDFPKDRQADLWGGIGEGCAYAGGVPEIDRLSQLVGEAGPYAEHLASGVAIGTLGRTFVGEDAAHTNRACMAVWGHDSSAMAEVTGRHAAEIDPRTPASEQCELWRSRLRQSWAAESRGLSSSQA